MKNLSHYALTTELLLINVFWALIMYREQDSPGMISGITNEVTLGLALLFLSIFQAVTIPLASLIFGYAVNVLKAESSTREYWIYILLFGGIVLQWSILLTGMGIAHKQQPTSMLVKSVMWWTGALTIYALTIWYTRDGKRARVLDGK